MAAIAPQQTFIVEWTLVSRPVENLLHFAPNK
jgi:hypothetical protein